MFERERERQQKENYKCIGERMLIKNTFEAVQSPIYKMQLDPSLSTAIFAHARA